MPVKEIHFKRHTYLHPSGDNFAIIHGQFPDINHLLFLRNPLTKFLTDIEAFFSFKDKQDGVGFLNV
jgi:hypothetical protein